MCGLQEKKTEKAKKERTPMPEQPADERRKNFNEVTLGYTKEDALAEASRCLSCKDPKCVEGCPVNVDIPGFIKLVCEEDFEGAIEKIKTTNALPAICGRVCPQETQCEALCVLGKKGQPVAIGRLERFCADYEREKGMKAPGTMPPTGKKVAVVGSGPASLTAAADLAKLGHKVTIFESLHKAGGVLSYGIPEFRLPKEIVRQEVEYIEKLGVEVKPNYVIGRIKTLDELCEEFDAVFLGTGAGLPNFMGIEGENLSGVYSANEFLTRVNLMKAYDPEYDTRVRCGKQVVVVGGGNVAMDAARSALRLGAEEVNIVYRRGEEEMPARREEVEHAKEEGIIFRFLTNPVRILGDEKFNVTGVECIKMELGEPDKSGRRSPAPVEGSEFLVPAEVVVIAIGTSPNPIIFKGSEGLEQNRRGTVVADDETGATSKCGVFAGGDVVTGAATVISAMGAGKKAAKAIDEYLRKK
ncbi:MULTISPECIES: NADPH-dependent glutamate synthase [unclassified Methanosarcina]|uniref:NADPH-dependent glutamate synthase n=1 Tax=unclassified Methanosarcina TaxID=2644672 RepID=UPI0006157BA8|nr:MULTISPECIES: NADPH-dependent glutamate synthase [unclassified Methanosarcina]AKB17730.1 Glutamate synthase [NADPH] small chain [Methanosarcina sp. WWM596]AKB21084.1 Glutamate synthase [NADPH] small chain [Methanosarcina sp. WH1]